MDEQYVEAVVLGIAYASKTADAYLLILKAATGERKLTLVVGQTEATAIAIELSHLSMPRPMTHDLMAQMMRTYGITIERVNILRKDDGLYYGEMLLDREGNKHQMDARPSDAVAVALRMSAPIFVSRETFDELGTDIPFERHDDQVARRLEDFTVEQLEQRMQYYVDTEAYEQAAEVQKIIKDKTKTAESNDNS